MSTAHRNAADIVLLKRGKVNQIGSRSHLDLPWDGAVLIYVESCMNMDFVRVMFEF